MVFNAQRMNNDDRRLIGHYRLIADGVDVSSVTTYADARRRRLLVNRLNSEGQAFIDEQGSIAREWRRPRHIRFIQK